MSEFNAALGLLQLRHIDKEIEKRQQIDRAYRQGLGGIKGARCLGDTGEQHANYAYFPILIDDEYSITRDELNDRMKESGIHPRRYFYPLISEFPMYRGLPSANRDNLPVASVAASQVLCLPIYPDLPIEVVGQVCKFIADQ